MAAELAAGLAAPDRSRIADELDATATSMEEALLRDDMVAWTQADESSPISGTCSGSAGHSRSRKGVGTSP
jgi:hypothetical protein